MTKHEEQCFAARFRGPPPKLSADQQAEARARARTARPAKTSPAAIMWAWRRFHDC